MAQERLATPIADWMYLKHEPVDDVSDRELEYVSSPKADHARDFCGVQPSCRIVLKASGLLQLNNRQMPLNRQIRSGPVGDLLTKSVHSLAGELNGD